MSWVPGSNKPTKEGADTAFWYWMYAAHAHWRLEEADGYEFGGARWWPLVGKIPILGGYVWIEQEYYHNIPTLLRWGATRKLSCCTNAQDIMSEEKQYKIFVTETGYIGGYGYFVSLKDGIYEFQGVGRPEIHP